MDKLYKVELKGIGEIIADGGTLDNLKSLLDQAYCYCSKKADEALKNNCYTLSSLYVKDQANIYESQLNIIEVLQKEAIK